MSDAAMNVRLGAKTSEFNRKLNKSTKKIQQFGKKMSQVGASMTRNFTMPLVLAGGGAIKLSLDFQKSMTKIQTLVGRTEGEIANMKKEILDMSGETAKSPVELAEGLYFLESAGLSGANSMETLNQVAKGSASGLGDMESLSTVAAAAQNAYGEETLSAADALDKFGVMVRTGMFDSQELSNVLGKQLGLASNLGISFDEVGALISTFTKTTGSATDGANALSAVMMTFAKLDAEPTKQQAEALDAIGLSATQVTDMIGDQGLNATLTMLQKKFGENGVSMASFFGKSQSLKGVLGVLGNQTEEYSSILEQMGQSTNFVSDAFDKTSQTDAFKMEQAMNNLRVAGTTFGDSLSPVVTQLTDTITKLTTAWNGLDDSTKQNIAKFLTWVAIAGPVIMIVGKGVVLFGKLRKAILLFKVQVAAAGGVMKYFNAVMAANPVGFIITAIAAVVGAIYYFSTSSSKVAVTVRNAFFTMVNFVIKAINGLIKAANKVSSALGLGTIPVIKEFKMEVYKAKEEVKDASGDVEDLAKNISNIKAPKVDMSGMNIDSGGGDSGGGDDGDDEAERIRNEENALKKIRSLKQKFNVINEQDKHKSDLIALENSRENELAAVKDTKHAEEEKLAINQYYDKKRENLIAKESERVEKELDKQLSKWEEYYKSISDGWNKAKGVAQQFFGAVTGALDAELEKEQTIMENKHELENQDYEQWYERELQKLEATKMNEEAKEKAIEELDLKAAEKKKALENQQDEETKKIQRKAARREKKMNIFNSIINTASAVVKALGSAPPPVNFILAGIVGGLGIAQTAAIASTPIPLAEGGIAFGPTTALIGEYTGAKNNPEVVAPLDKLKNIIGNNEGKQQIEVFGRIDGNDIVLTNDLTTQKRLRYT